MEFIFPEGAFVADIPGFPPRSKPERAAPEEPA